MKNQAQIKEPKPRIAFLNNYRAAVLAVMALLISSVAISQTDSLKYSQINGYGFKYKRHVQDSVSIIPLSTSPHTPYRAGGIRYRASDSTIQIWTGYQWNSIITGVGNGVDTAYALNDSIIAIETPDQDFYVTLPGRHWTLQGVTDNGNKTTDTIIAGGLRTQYILPDTLAEPDYVIVVPGDLQGMTSGFPDQLYSIFNWIRDNKTIENIKGVIPVGDLTESNTTTEWLRLDTAVKKIDSLDIPFLPVLGNHDYEGGGFGIAGKRWTTNYCQYFGINRYAGKPWQGNAFHDSTDNYYIKVDVGSDKYLFLGMEFIPTDSALAWAASVVDSFPDRKVIVSTHAYITVWGERSVDSSLYSGVSYNLTADNSGQEMWEKFVRKHKNIMMVLNGHFISTAYENQGYSKRVSNVADSGNLVHQIFVNYQRDGNATYINPNGSNNAGMGYFMKLRFSPSKGRVYVSYYSPFLNQFDSRIDSFSLSNPPVEVQTSLTVSDGLYVRGETVLDSNVFISKLSKNNILISSVNSKIDTVPNVASTAAFLANNGFASPARFRTLLSSDIPSGSNYYINNETGVVQTAGFRINGTGIVTAIGSWPSAGLQGNAGGNFNVVHAGGSNGLVITRATADANGANLNFYKTNNTDASVRTAVTAGTIIGSIRFQAVANDNLPYLGSLINGTADSVGASSIWGGLIFSTGVFTERMRINRYGRVGIGSAAQNATLPDLLNVFGTTRVTDTFKTPNILTQYDTTNFKPVVADASGNHYKMVGWPLVTGSITSINSMAGPGITIQGGTATSVSSGSNTVTVNVTPSSLALPHTLNKQYADANNTGTGETDLYTYTLPANTLTIDGRSTHFEVAGQSNDATATTALQMYFAGISFGNTGAVVLINTGAWTAKGKIIRTGSTTARADINFSLKAGTTDSSYTFQQDLTGLDFTVGNILKITGQAGGAGGGNNDITSKSWIVTYWPE